MPCLLVRPLRVAASHAGINAYAFRAHRQVGRLRDTTVPDGITLSGLRPAAATGPRPPAEHRVHLLDLRRRSWALHPLHRFPARERFHQTADTATDRRT